MRRGFARGVVVAGLLAATATWADEPDLQSLKPPVSAPAAHDSLGDVMQAEPQCQSFTNGCEICRRSDAGPQCSTPGPACQPRDWRCERPPADPS